MKIIFTWNCYLELLIIKIEEKFTKRYRNFPVSSLSHPRLPVQYNYDLKKSVRCVARLTVKIKMLEVNSQNKDPFRANPSPSPVGAEDSALWFFC